MPQFSRIIRNQHWRNTKAEFVLYKEVNDYLAIYMGNWTSYRMPREHINSYDYVPKSIDTILGSGRKTTARLMSRTQWGTL